MIKNCFVMHKTLDDKTYLSRVIARSSRSNLNLKTEIASSSRQSGLLAMTAFGEFNNPEYKNIYIQVLDTRHEGQVFYSDAQERRRGFVALVMITVIGAAALLIAMSSSLLGIGALSEVYTAERGNEAFYAADGCVEEALRRLRLNAGYTGAGEIITFPQLSASCTVTVTNLGSSGRRIIATGFGANGMYQRSIQMEITLSAQNVITVTSWQETML